MGYEKAKDLYQKKTNWFAIIAGIVGVLFVIGLIAGA